MEPTKNSYDKIPYPAYSYPESHPDHLAMIASLYGVSSTPIGSCRVLELGCAEGGNLIPLACELAHSEFVGIDLSPRQVALAQEKIKALGLRNISVQCLSILDINKDLGSFDYIIAHGVYSWVNAEVQQKLLHLCHDLLAPNGIVYISYNTYPGWHMRGMLRDMMRYYTQDIKEDSTIVQQAKAFIGFLAESVPYDNDPYALLLKNESEKMNTWEENYFRHDSLEDINDPVYFNQFITRTRACGLHYLADADHHLTLSKNFLPNVQNFLEKYEDDIVKKEQYIDFFRNRMFRKSLLCKEEVNANNKVPLERLPKFYYAAPIQTPTLSSIEFSPNNEAFYTLSGRLFLCTWPWQKALYTVLSQQWPLPLDEETLFAKMQPLLDASNVTVNLQMVKEELYKSFEAGIVLLKMHPIENMTLSVDDYPQTSALIRYDAHHNQTWVTNLRHEVIHIDEVSSCLLKHLDGKNSAADLADILLDYLKAANNKSQQEFTVTKALLDEKIPSVLSQFARCGLLCSPSA